MIYLVRKELRERRISLIFYCLAVFALIWIYVMLFPSLQSQAQNYNKIFETLPDAYKKAFGVTNSSLSSITSYLSIELYSMIWPLLAIFLLFSRSVGTFAGEIERNTISTLLSQPLSRSRLFAAKYLAGGVSWLLFIIASFLCVLPLATLYGVHLDVVPFLRLTIVALFFGLAIYGIGLLFGVVFSEKGKAYGIGGAIFLIMYVCNILSSIKPNLDSLKYISIFHYFNSSNILSANHLAWSSILLFSGIATITTFFAVWWFNRRDISI